METNESPQGLNAKAICRIIRDNGGAAHIVGGAVRDMLLGKQAKDYDIVTSLMPEGIADAFPSSRPVGQSFMVSIVEYGGHKFEVATYRKDGMYSDGRHPDSIRIGTIEEDAARRDFACNAIYWDPIDDVFYDPYDGIGDIRRGVLRCVGDPIQRFSEDVLRIIRMSRIAAKSGFSVDGPCMYAAGLISGRLDTIAKERVREEITGGITGPGAERFLQLFRESGAMTVVLPEIERLYSCDQDPEWHPEGDVGVHTAKVVENISPEKRGMVLSWAALLHDVGKPQTYAIKNGRVTAHGHAEAGADIARLVCENMRMPSAAVDAVEWLVRFHMKPIEARKMRNSTLKMFIGNPLFSRLLELHRADCLGSCVDPAHAKMDTYEYLLRKVDEYSAQPVLPPCLIDGRDVMALGVEPGPVIGRIIRSVYNMQLEGIIGDKDTAINAASCLIDAEVKADRA